MAAEKEEDMIVDCFIKSYAADKPWLQYCLRSIQKFATGFRTIHLVVPDTRKWWDGSYAINNLHVTEAEEYGNDGYLSQQVFKLHADTISDAEFILFMDSDTIFTRPVTPETFFINDKIAWLYTPYSKIKTPWQPIIEQFFRHPVAFEFMRRHPIIVPSWLLPALRKYCRTMHDVQLNEYVMAQPHRAFSEFNALGGLAYYYHRDMFHWINTEVDLVPELTTLQKWSYGGLNPEIVAEFEQILSQ